MDGTQYRARIDISGMTYEYLYSENEVRLRKRAVKRLTRFKPGHGSLYPHQFVIERRLLLSEGWVWQEFEKTKYESIPEEEWEWKKKE